MNVKLLTLLTGIFLCANGVCSDLFVQPFAIQGEVILRLSIPSLDEKATFIDFDGDSCNDLLIQDSALKQFSIGLNPQNYNINHFMNRIEIVYSNTSSWERVLYAASNAFKENRANDRLVFVNRHGQMNLVQFSDNADIAMRDRYNETVYNLSLPDDSHTCEAIQFHECFDANGQENSNLLVITSNQESSFLHAYHFPFQSTSDIGFIDSSSTHPFPGVPTNYFTRDFNGDRCPDLFFECKGEWQIWLTAEDSIEKTIRFEPNNPERSFAISIPAEVVRSTDVIEGYGDYAAFVGIESEITSDIAFAAFPRERIDNPVYVSIPNKHRLGNTCRLYAYENKAKGETRLICIIYNRINEDNPQENTFYIYQIDPDRPESPQLLQSFVPEYNIENYKFYFDRPMLLGDYDNDGVSDIVMSGVLVPDEIDEENSVTYYILGFQGIASDTRISEWSVYE